MQNIGMNKLQFKLQKSFPNTNSLLKISLGLILFTIISTVLVYAETISVDVDGTSYNVDYTATGVNVSGIEADDFGALLIFVEVTESPSFLEIILNRDFYDSTFEGLDEEFFILVDGVEGVYTEEITSDSRTLRIELPFGTEEIEIIGNASFGPSMVEEIPEETPAIEDKPVVTPPAIEDKPVVTPPAIEDKPVVTPPKVQCGPGTILKDGACILDERCGPGTVLKDGVCVLDSIPKPSETSSQGIGKEMIIAVIAAFILAGSIGIILALISKASKSKD